MNKPTRKSIKDRNGIRSIYVVEWKVHGIWKPYSTDAGHKEYSDALYAMKEVYRLHKCRDQSCTHSDFRVALYERVEN